MKLCSGNFTDKNITTTTHDAVGCLIDHIATLSDTSKEIVIQKAEYSSLL